MAQQQQISVYGGSPLSEEDKAKNRKKLYKYIEAVIKAELLNPETDYEDERQLHLLKQIAISDLDFWDREKLVNLLMENENEK